MSSNFRENSQARQTAVEFLYRCEVERVFYFSLTQFEQHGSAFEIPERVALLARGLCQGVFDRKTQVDERLGKASTQWSVDRMAMMDRCILRLAIFELLESKVPFKVVLNEAIDLAKRFGSENSGRFVNGILDSVVKELNTKSE